MSTPQRPRTSLTAADGDAIVHAIDVARETWFALELRFGKQHNKLRAAYLAAKGRRAGACTHTDRAA